MSGQRIAEFEAPESVQAVPEAAQRSPEQTRRRVNSYTCQKVSDCRLLSIKDSARYLGLSVWFVRTLLWDGKLPFLAVAGKHMIDRKDLDAFVEREKQVHGIGHSSGTPPRKRLIGKA